MHFASGHDVAVDPGGTTLTLTVPPGVRSCDLSVAVSRSFPDGSVETKTSNALPFLVVWRFLNRADLRPSGVNGWIVQLSGSLPGEPDALWSFVRGYTYPSWTGNRYELSRLAHDGTRTLAFSRRTTDTSTVIDESIARSPTTGELVGLLRPPSGPVRLVSLTSGLDLYTDPVWPTPGWWLAGVAFDLAGNLLVAATDSSDALMLWRFSPGEPVVLAPGSPSCLVPFALDSRSWDFPRRLAVAGDGTIFVLMSTYSHPAPWQEPIDVLVVPPDGSARVVTLPELDPANGTGWRLAADCRGEGYALGLGDDPSVRELHVLRLSDLSEAAVLPGWTYLLGAGTDGIGDLFVNGTRVDGGVMRSGLHRLSPAEVGQGFYCSRGRELAGVRARVLDGNDPCGMCFEGPGELVISIDGIPFHHGQTATIPLGKRIEVKAWWQRTPFSTPDAVDAKWWLAEPQPEWRAEHDDAVGYGLEESSQRSASAVLFQGKVALLFDEGNPEARIHSIEAVAVHTGTVGLNTQCDRVPGGDPDASQLTLRVSYENAKLGSGPSAYDEIIFKWANAYGLPPQYIKGLAQKESNFYEREYRYEPQGWDYGETLGGRGIAFALADDYFEDFRFAEPGGIPGVGGPLAQGATLSQTDIDRRVGARFTFFTTPGTAGPCTRVTSGSGPLSAWELVLGSNGLPHREPFWPYYPCNARWGWDGAPDLFFWDHARPNNFRGDARAGSWWFFNNPDYVAQTFLAASYGLAQVGYGVPLHDLEWWKHRPDSRDYEVVIHPVANLYLGSRWLASPSSRKALRDLKRESEHSKASFDLLLRRLLCAYNSGKLPNSCAYAAKVLSNAQSFGPTTDEP